MTKLALGALHLTKPTGLKHSATVIFFHGSGSSGEDMKEWVRLMGNHFSFPHIKILYPTAPLQPYTPAGGCMSNVWFDRGGIAPQYPEKLDSINDIGKLVKSLISEENKAGIPSNRIVVGGFSMGGSLAMHSAFRWEPAVAGAFVFSSFLNDNSVVYSHIKQERPNQLPKLLQLHGNSDDLVFFDWGAKTFKELESLGVEGQFHSLDKLGHSINKKGIALIKAFVESLLPEN